MIFRRLLLLVLVCLALLAASTSAQEVRRVGRLQEAFAWKQITYNIDGNMTCLIACLTLLTASTSAQEVRRVGRLQEAFAWKLITYNIDGNMNLLLMLACLALLAASTSAQEIRRVGRLQEAFAWKQITYNIDGNMMKMRLLIACLALLAASTSAQEVRRVGRLQEAFAWKLITYNIDGNMITTDRFSEEDVQPPANHSRVTRQAGFNRNMPGQGMPWRNNNNMYPGNLQNTNNYPGRWPNPNWRTNAPPMSSVPPMQPPMSSMPFDSTTANPNQNQNDEANRFFIQYNNLPMGVERAGNRLFITIPRRRYGIPSTLNYLDLTRDTYSRSPGLRPYPNLQVARTLTSVYRTRADHCNRLWMVDNGLLEITNNMQQLQQPGIVVFDLTTDTQIFRYPFKNSDMVSANTPMGLASITLDFPTQDCSTVYAYIPDLQTYGLIVYSLRENDSWRLSHNYFSFNPIYGNLRISGQYFQWSDGIFSLTVTQPGIDTCRTAYFHALASITTFSVSTCVLRNRTASQDPNFWQMFSVVGERGANTQSTTHLYSPRANALFWAEIGRDALSCWNTGMTLEPQNVVILAQDSLRLSYPADLSISGDELWLMVNKMPQWSYGRLNTNEYNYYIYR
ncbi:major royal jelly protein domain-containing protein [Phthorimaea operculella]|nr:major royal jelly protein domain-containing protein [Phthorimaea operculella]